MERVIVDQLLFRFSTCGSIPEIFAIKFESCQKSRKILDDFFGPPKFGGQAFQKVYPVYHSCLVTRRLKKFQEDTPTSPEVIEPNTLNFMPNFKFSRLKFFWGPSSPLEVCSTSCAHWSICSACKNLRGQHALRAEI